MSAISIASVPVEMAGFPVIKNAEAAFNNNYSTHLKEWLECQDFMLGMKAINIGFMPVNIQSLRHFKTTIQDVVKVPHHKNPAISIAMEPIRTHMFHACETAVHAANCVKAVTESALDQLYQASLRDKREVLRYMPIIPTAIAAAYIGVSEHALNKWQSYTQTFGASYAGAHCYSMEELKMIANNRDWIYSEMGADLNRSTAVDDEKALDEVVLVDPDVATAFADLAYSELAAQLPLNQLIKRPFRLSDLEKIRVAKLNATAEK